MSDWMPAYPGPTLAGRARLKLEEAGASAESAEAAARAKARAQPPPILHGYRARMRDGERGRYWSCRSLRLVP
jgi:hypothetical protein